MNQAIAARIAQLLALIGGIAGLVNAIWALSAVGNNPEYAARLWSGAAALVLPIVAILAAFRIRESPKVMGGIILAAGILGFVAINLFYINTYYFISVPFLLGAALFAFLTPKKVSDRSMPGV